MKKILMSDNAFRVYSVIAAIMMWILIVYSQDPERTRRISEIPVYISNQTDLQNEGYTVVLPDESYTVSISVKGKRIAISKVDRSNVSAFVTVPKLAEGTYDVPINVSLPISEVSLSDKTPYTIGVTVDKIVSKTFDIQVRTKGEIDASSKFTSELGHKTVNITGPESVINQIYSVYAEVNFETKSSIQDYDLHVEAKDKKDMTDNPNLNMSIRKVSVASSYYKTMSLPIKPDFKNAPEQGYIVSAYKVIPENITVGHEEGKFDEIEYIETEEIDLSGRNGSMTVQCGIVIPEGYTNADETEQVTVEITIEPSEEKIVTVPADKIELIGGAANAEYAIETANLEVVIEAPKSLMQTAGENISIAASVDVSDAAEGYNYLSAEFNLPDGFKLKGTYKVVINCTYK